jgi:protein O-mannosyl-transferase
MSDQKTSTADGRLTARRLPPWTMVAPLAVLAIVAFLPVLDNDFVNLDDHANFLGNPYYRGLGREQLAWAWTTEWLGVYQPLAWMVLEAEYAACGLEPRGYHMASLLLNALTAVALYALTRVVVGRARPDLLVTNPTGVVLGSALAVALFIVHPMRVEVVAWASGQPYLPCAALAVAAVLVYLRAADAPPSRGALGLIGAWILFALALLFKAAAVPLPAVLLVLDYYPLRRLGGGPGRWLGPPARRVWAEKVPFIALSLIFAALAVHAKRDTLVALERRGPVSRVAQACYGACFYLGKTVWPTGLSAYYPVPNPFDWRAPTYLACAAVMIVASAALFLLRRRHPGLLAAWLAYLVVLAPTAGLVTISSQITADRYSYLATMSVVPLLAAAVAQLTGPGRGRTPVTHGVVAAGLGLVAALAGSSWALCRSWRDTADLASHALANGWRDPEILLGLGWGLEERGDLAGADASYCDSLRLDPFHIPALVGLGRVRLRQGRAANAAALLTEVIRLQPDMPENYNTLGLALAAQGRLDEAIARFSEALRLRPDFAEARANLSRVKAARARRRSDGAGPDDEGRRRPLASGGFVVADRTGAAVAPARRPQGGVSW